YTGCATAAVVRHRIIIFQIQINNQFSNKIEGTQLFGEQIAVFANPAQSAFCGPSLVQNRRGIYKSTTVNISNFFGNKFRQLFQLIFYYEMIVGAVSVF